MADTNLVYPYEFQGGTKAVASEVNANFEAVRSFAGGINATLDELRSAIADLKNKPTREMFDIYYSFSSNTPAGAYPLWTGETITHCKSLYPDFWNKLNNLVSLGNVVSVTEDEYEEKLEEYGQCAGFYIDSLNGHVRLPKITRFISGIEELSQLAAEENSVNTSHTHNLKAYTGSGNMNASEDRYLGSGTDNSKSDMFWSDTTDVENTAAVVSQGEEEGHPKNVRLCLYIQVANNLGELSELDTAAIAKELESGLIALENAYTIYSTELNKLYAKVKQDILSSSPVVKDVRLEVTPEMFKSDDTYEEYPYSADIEFEDASSELIPTVNFNLAESQSGNYAPVAESLDGYVRIYAKQIPEQSFEIASIILQ